MYAGHEKEAEALSQLDDIRVSHGMPSRFIVRRKDDPTIIDFHVTSEISPLPGWAAANPLTEFVVLSKESRRHGIYRQKSERTFAQAGLPRRVIAELEANLAPKERRQLTPGWNRKKPPVADAPAETPATPAYVTAQEVADAVGALVTPITQALAAMTQIAYMQAEVKTLKETDEAKVAKAAGATPRRHCRRSWPNHLRR